MDAAGDDAVGEGGGHYKESVVEREEVVGILLIYRVPSRVAVDYFLISKVGTRRHVTARSRVFARRLFKPRAFFDVQLSLLPHSFTLNAFNMC